ncbi:MAG: DUF1080 domain-containing protein [Isosphaeraceae bacterium]|nr:DUF1080 domain-containing protein [Isosphaeraceae bacterium]
MRFRHALPVLAGVLAVAASARLAPAADFTPLFNGKDLSGWIQPAADSGATFTVEDGAIVGRTNGKLKKNEFLVTEKPYADFILEAKVKIRNGNSGIQIRSTRKPDGVVAGPQADVADGYWGLLYEERMRGILERYPKEKAEELVKKDDWNDFVVEFKGKRLIIKINGTTVIDRTDDKFADSGIIALQVHVGPEMEVRYKDIKIKPLD